MLAVILAVLVGIFIAALWPTASQPQSIQLSCVDLTPFTADPSTFRGNLTEAKLASAQQFIRAAKDTGAVRITGHNIQRDDELFDVARHLFNLSASTKNATQYKREGFVRGFIPIAGESGSASTLEVKEGFSYGYEWPTDKATENRLQGSNVWPNELSKSEISKLQKVYSELVRVSLVLAEVVPTALNWPVQKFTDLYKGGDEISLLRMFHYFGKSSPEYERYCGPEMRGTVNDRGDPICIGSSQHTDWGFLTIIIEEPMDHSKAPSSDENHSLQVYRDGTWFSVQHEHSECKDSLIFNAGDYLSVLSGGLYMSPKHRVLLQQQERYSFVFFSYPNFDATLESLFPSDEQNHVVGELSLFENQQVSSDNTGTKVEELKSEGFGNYILRKWKQVSRDS